MQPKRRQYRFLFLAFPIFLLTSFGAVAQELRPHEFKLDVIRFDDENGNSLIDCGETVTLRAVLFSTGDVDPSQVFRGRVTIPSDTPSRWLFMPGTVQQEPSLSSSCTMLPVLGNNPGDPWAVYDYQCQVTPPANSYMLTVELKGMYTGPTGPVIVPGSDQRSSPVIETLLDAAVDARIQSCASVDLLLSKSDGGASVRPGNTVAYSLSFSNQGNLSGASVMLQETVPANTTFNAGSSSAGWTCSPSPAAGSTCTLSLGNLAAGASGSKSFAVDLSPSVNPSVTQISNTAAISSISGDSDLSNNTATDTTTVIPGTPDLALTKTIATNGGAPGSLIVFNLSLSNQGNGLAQSVTLSDTLSPNAGFVSASSSPGWSCSGTTCSLSVGDLPPGQTTTRTFAVRVVDPLPAGVSNISNSACAATTTAGDPGANNCSSVSAPITASAALDFRKTLRSGTGAPGSVLVFDLIVTNNGDQDASSVALQETVPAATSFAPASSSSGWSCPAPTAGTSCSLVIPSLSGRGGTATRSFAVTIANPLPAGVSSVANSACASTQGASNDCDTVTIPTDGRPMLSVAKRLKSGTASPGGVLIYEISVQNTGNQDAGGVTLSEVVPTATTFEGAPSSSGWSCVSPSAGSTCTVAIGSVIAGAAPTTRDFAVRIASTLPAEVKEITNTACAGAGVCDTVTVPHTGAPVLAIDKNLISGAAEPGGLLTYSISVTNSGNQDAGAVSLTETVPQYTQYEAVAGGPAWACSPNNQAASTCTLSMGGPAAGERKTATFSVRVLDTIPASAASIRNVACVAEAGNGPGCDTFDVPLLKADVRLTKSYSGPPVTPGATLPFTLTISNTGNRDGGSLRLRETVPANSTFNVSGSDSRWSCSAVTPGSTCILTLPSVPAGSSINIVFAVRASNPLPPGVRQISNAACLEALSGDALNCDNEATPLDVSVESTLDDQLLKDLNGNGILDSGDTLRYTLVVTNTSDKQARDLVVRCALDPHVGLVTGSVGTTAGSVLAGNSTGETLPTLRIPTLEAGETVTITFDALALSLRGVKEISSQGSIEGSNFMTEPTDDPATDLDDDPTVTPLGVSLVEPIPTLDEVGLVSLAGLLGFCSLVVLKKRKNV